MMLRPMPQSKAKTQNCGVFGKGSPTISSANQPNRGGAVAYHKSVWQTLSWWDHVYPATLKEYSSHDIILDFSILYFILI